MEDYLSRRAGTAFRGSKEEMGVSRETVILEQEEKVFPHTSLPPGTTVSCLLTGVQEGHPQHCQASDEVECWTKAQALVSLVTVIGLGEKLQPSGSSCIHYRFPHRRAGAKLRCLLLTQLPDFFPCL